MAEQKMMHGKEGHFLFILGVLAFVYGLINYFIMSLHWPMYGAWMVGGVALVLVSWAKKNMMAQK